MTTNAGRPTLYTEELLEKARDYIINYDSYGDAIPSIVGLCNAIGITRTTGYEWSRDETKEFSYIFDKIMEKQEQTLLNSGLRGDFNSTITKLILTKHGYSDKQETEVSGKGGGAIQSAIEVSFVGSSEIPEEA